MPDVKVVSPAAVVPADRLTLGSCDARINSEPAYKSSQGITLICMAEE